MFPEIPTVCPLSNSSRCAGFFDGYGYAINDAIAGGYLDLQKPGTVAGAYLPTLSEAQVLMPTILLVLVAAFGARLIIQLVKKG